MEFHGKDCAARNDMGVINAISELENIHTGYLSDIDGGDGYFVARSFRAAKTLK